MLNTQVKKMYAYTFEGYWKDVGTIDSLWESNMDLLNPKIELDLNDELEGLQEILLCLLNT